MTVNGVTKSELGSLAECRLQASGVDRQHCPPELLAGFADCLRDSLLHVLFSPTYFFHRAPEEDGAVRPLFGIELAMFSAGQRDPRMLDLLARVDAVLAAFGRTTARSYLAAVFDLEATIPAAGEAMHAHVGKRRFDLLDRDDQRRFVGLDPIAVGGSFGVHSSSNVTVLVLGSYHPPIDDYVSALLDDPVAPRARLAGGQSLTEIEKTLLICDQLAAAGYESVTPKAHRRELPNVFERTTRLMADADRIVLLLARGGSGVAMEYGIVCADPSLAGKTTVFVPAGEPITGLARFGSFLLERPTTLVHRDEHDLLEQIDRLFAPTT